MPLGPTTAATLQDILEQLTQRGRVQRGYFMAGLNPRQYALPAAIEVLRGVEPTGDTVFELAANDPANPYGRWRRWPEWSKGASRSPGVELVIQGGQLLSVLGKGGHRLSVAPLTGGQATAVTAWLHRIAQRLDLRIRELRSPDAEVHKTLGLRVGYGGWCLPPTS